MGDNQPLDLSKGRHPDVSVAGRQSDVIVSPAGQSPRGYLLSYLASTSFASGCDVRDCGPRWSADKMDGGLAGRRLLMKLTTEEGK
ncbi:hypothetical protein BaRGS_00004525 [Batillaria attramentaria]|uniref:Uncharacterized protein n=1 Tax=Batillaria attramentaria TaxID=370345 RepID=A0ABD0LXM8_9CAEN